MSYLDDLQRQLEVLADCLASPAAYWWPTLDAILALPEVAE